MTVSTRLDGRTAAVTGAARGLGRAHALALAAHGARLVLNDAGEEVHEVAAEIRAAGGQAAALVGDAADTAAAERLVATAAGLHGGLDILVNNAGVTRDRMLFNMAEEDWDTVLRVHLKGHFATSRAAAAHWRARSKAAGAPVYGRIVNTASEAFLLGSPGQPNAAAAKGGIAALTASTAQGLRRYGVTANAICPRARTGMTAGVFGPPPRRRPRPARRRARLPAGLLPRLRRGRRRHRTGVRGARRRHRGAGPAQRRRRAARPRRHRVVLRRPGRPGLRRRRAPAARVHRPRRRRPALSGLG